MRLSEKCQICSSWTWCGRQCAKAHHVEVAETQAEPFTKPFTKQKPSTDRVKKWRKNNKEAYNAYQREYQREYMRKRRAAERSLQG